jgi:SAM-dependent methyltransferase
MTHQMSYETYSGGPAANYERYFVPAIGAPVAHDLIELAELRPGEHVLDVACGTGVVTRLAAEQVGGGAVAGVDINPGMLQVARNVAGDTAIEWHEASAEALPLGDATFDVALCQMGLQFFPDRPGALREMRRVLRPGGRVVINVPGPTPPPLAAPARRPRAGAATAHRPRGRGLRRNRLLPPRHRRGPHAPRGRRLHGRGG